MQRTVLIISILLLFVFVTTSCGDSATKDKANKKTSQQQKKSPKNTKSAADRAKNNKAEGGEKQKQSTNSDANRLNKRLQALVTNYCKCSDRSTDKEQELCRSKVNEMKVKTIDRISKQDASKVGSFESDYKAGIAKCG